MALVMGKRFFVSNQSLNRKVLKCFEGLPRTNLMRETIPRALKQKDISCWAKSHRAACNKHKISFLEAKQNYAYQNNMVTCSPKAVLMYNLWLVSCHFCYPGTFKALFSAQAALWNWPWSLIIIHSFYRG